MSRAAYRRAEITRVRTPGIVELPARKLTHKRLDGRPSRDLAKVVDAYELQLGVINAQAAKSVVAMRKLLELHQHGAVATRELAAYLCYLDHTAAHLNGPYRDILAQAMREQLILFIEQAHGLMRLGGTRSAKEVFRTTRPVLKKPGLLYRLLFGDKEMPSDEE